MEKIRARIGARFCFTINAHSKSGGLAFLWFDDIDLEIINFSTSHIHTKIKDSSNGAKYFLTGFYGVLETAKQTQS